MGTVVFAAQPDRYGRFGHQSFCLLTSLLLADFFGGKFLPLRYEYFAHRFNKIIDFSQSSLSVGTAIDSTSIHFIKREPFDAAGNTKYDFSNCQDFGDLADQVQRLKRIPTANNILFLPFDQFPGALLRTNPERIVFLLQEILTPEVISQPEEPYIALHIRRGDVSRETYPDWFIPDIFYERLLLIILDVLPLKYHIKIFTQGALDFLAEELKCNIRAQRIQLYFTSDTWTNDQEVDAFVAMAQSEFIIGGLSSFSMLASLVKHGRHQISCRNRSSRAYPHPVKVGIEIFTDYSDDYIHNLLGRFLSHELSA